MISFKVEGLDETLKDVKDFTLNTSEIYKVVSKASQGMVDEIKQGYIAAGHNKTGALVNSIEMFKRKQDGKFYAYYVGPRYTKARGGLSGGGNAAHLLEYGTKMRYSANAKLGGAKIGGRVYGAKISRGQILAPTIGVIRKSFDQFKNQGEDILMSGMNELINKELTQRGFN